MCTRNYDRICSAFEDCNDVPNGKYLRRHCEPPIEPPIYEYIEIVLHSDNKTSFWVVSRVRT